MWFVVYGVWFMVYGVWCMVYGVWCMVYGLWFTIAFSAIAIGAVPDTGALFPMRLTIKHVMVPGGGAIGIQQKADRLVLVREAVRRHRRADLLLQRVAHTAVGNCSHSFRNEACGSNSLWTDIIWRKRLITRGSASGARSSRCHTKLEPFRQK